VKKASITETKNNLSSILDRVKAGTTVLIVDRGRPVARIEPVAASPALSGEEDAGRLARLAREGLVHPAKRPLPKELLTPPPRPERTAPGVRILLDERRTGR
jgi:prevent-host-death family protein